MIQKGHNSEAKLVLSLAVQICFKIGEAFFLILFHEFIGVAAAVTDCPVMNQMCIRDSLYKLLSLSFSHNR